VEEHCWAIKWRGVCFSDGVADHFPVCWSLDLKWTPHYIRHTHTRAVHKETEHLK